MGKENRTKIKIDKDKEMRTKDISKMIGEGGLGADRYYDIKKKDKDKSNSEPSDEEWQWTNLICKYELSSYNRRRFWMKIITFN